MRHTTESRFCCALCGSHQYEAVIVTLPSGAAHKSSLFECAGCSVVFRDKDKFTRRAKYHQNPTAEGASGQYMEELPPRPN